MVDLPKVPRRFVTTDTPQSPLSPGDIAAPYKMLAKGLDDLGEGLSDLAVPFAEAAGYKAVTTDQDGNLQVQRAPIVGKAGVAFSRAVKVAAMAEGETSSERDLLQMRNEFRNDPKGFQERANGYREQKIENYRSTAGEAVGVALGRSIDGSITRMHTGLVNEQQQLELRRSASAIDTRITTLADDMETLARKNGIGAEYKEKLANLDALLAEKVNNPLFAFPREKADALRDSVITRVQGAAVLETTERVYQERGFEAAKDYLRTSVKALDGKVKQLDRVEREGLGWLRTQEASFRGERDGIAREWSAAKPLIEQLAPSQLQDMAQRAYAVGAHRVGRDIEANAQALEIASAVRSLPRAEQARILGTGQISGALVDRVVAAESGGDPNAAATTSSARGAGQFVNSTWLDLVKRTRPDLAAGKSDQDILALRSDPALSREMVGRYAEQNKATLASAGVRTDDGALYLAHFLGPGDAIKVLSAAPDAPLAGLVQQGSIDANKGIFSRNPTAGQLQQWASGKVGGANLAESRAGLLALGQIKKGLQADLPKRITDFKAAVGKQELPDAKEIEALGAEVALLGTPDQKREVAEIAAIAEYGKAFAQMPAPQRAAIVSQWEARMRDGASKFERQLGETIRSADQKIDAAYKTDPYGAFVRFAEGAQPTRAVDFINPTDAADVLRERVTQQGQIRAYERRGPFSALRPDEARGVAANLTQADPQAAAATLDILRQVLPADIYRETITDGPIVKALHGMAHSYDPIRIEAAMKTLDKLSLSDPSAFAKEPQHGGFGGDTLKRLQVWQSFSDKFSRDEIAAKFKEFDSPQAKGQKEFLEDLADKELKKSGTVSKIATALTGAWFFQGSGAPADEKQQAALAVDYKTIYTELRKDGVSAADAEKRTIERMKMVWAPSEMFGGQLMKHPPDLASRDASGKVKGAYYDLVNDSHDWMKKPLEAAIAEATGKPMFTDKVGIPGVTAGPLSGGLLGADQNWEYRVISVPETAADIAAGVGPRYQVWVNSQGKGWNALPKLFDWRKEQEAAKAEALATFEDRRGARREMFPPQTPLGEGGAGPEAEKKSERNVVQRTFLTALDAAERAGFGGTAVKLYNDVIQRGRTAPITEADLSQSDLSGFEKLVRDHAAETGQKSGKIDYKDYAKHAPSLDGNIIGGFKYSIGKDGSISIDDTWDFNADRAGAGENNIFIQAIGAFVNPRGLAAIIGRDTLPDTSGKGIPVRIRIGRGA